MRKIEINYCPGERDELAIDFEDPVYLYVAFRTYGMAPGGSPGKSTTHAKHVRYLVKERENGMIGMEKVNITVQFEIADDDWEWLKDHHLKASEIFLLGMTHRKFLDTTEE